MSLKFISTTLVLFLTASLGQTQSLSSSSSILNAKTNYTASLTSNVAELVKGNGNVTLEFFSGAKSAGFFSAALSSLKEKRPRLSNAEYTVDRSQYTLGLVWYKNEIDQKKNCESF